MTWGGGRPERDSRGGRPLPLVPGGGPGALLPPSYPTRTRVPGRPGVGTWLSLVVLGVLTLVAIGVVGVNVGQAVLPLAALLALVPLVGVLLGVRWVDRWEREPWPALVVAFGWGASVSVLVALVLNSGAVLVLLALGSSAPAAETWGATVVAPVVEESIKGLGVLLIFLAWRRSFDGPVDGLVYAATVAAGFAFVENILYFGEVIRVSAGTADAGSAIATVFALRGIMSPFAHLLFTACTGLALGVAARSASRGLWVVTFPVGLVLAMVLHGLWNGSAAAGDGSAFLTMYVTFQVPLFLGVFGLVVWLRRQEGAVVRDRLSEYASGGWFGPGEVPMLASLSQRRHARRWAAERGGAAAERAMRDLQTTATRLAYHRHRVLIDRADPRAQQDESALLAALLADRRRLAQALAR